MEIISDADAAAFVQGTPSRDNVLRLQAPALRLVAQHLGAENVAHLCKSDLSSLVVDLLGLSVAEGNTEMLQGDVASLDESSPEQTAQPRNSGAAAPVSDELERLRLQIELTKQQAELARAEMQRDLTRSSDGSSSRGSDRNTVVDGSSLPDLAKCVKLLPAFDEKCPENFFVLFERTAFIGRWPRSTWPLLIQHRLVGEAQAAHSNLSAEDSENYELIKSAVLDAYKMVPDAYRKRFRDLKRREGQTHLAFAKAKDVALTNWLRSRKVSTFEELKQLLLIEDFRWNVTEDVSSHLSDKPYATITEAATRADTYVLNRSDKGAHRQAPKHSQADAKPDRAYPGKKPSREGGATAIPSSTRPKAKGHLSCAHCKRSGHVREYCYLLYPHLKPKAGGKPKPALTASASLSSPGQEASGRLTGDEALSSVSKDPDSGTYRPFLSVGSITHDGQTVPVTVLRDTGALISLLRADVALGRKTGKFIDVAGVSGTFSAPLVHLYLDSTSYNGPATVAVVHDLPVREADLLLGNDLAGGRVGAVSHAPPPSKGPEEPLEQQNLEAGAPQPRPQCAVTRSAAARLRDVEESAAVRAESVSHRDLDISRLFPVSEIPSPSADRVPVGRAALIAAQEGDETLQDLWSQVRAQTSEAGARTEYFVQNGVLSRRWLPPAFCPEDEPWAAVTQIVVPVKYRQALIELAHDGRFSGHVGVRNTTSKLQRHFYWPSLRADVARHCKECIVCQQVGKVNTPPKIVPLCKIPHLPEPFTKVQVDVVGPLPRTSKSNEYIITLIDTTSRYPHAVAVRAITARAITKVLMDFFSLFGLPRRLQTDGASYFVGNHFREFCDKHGIEHSVSSPYHPQSQGALERAHQTMKSILRKYAHTYSSSWDENLPYMLFVLRDLPSESTGFSAYELIFAHRVRGPLSLVHSMLFESPENLVSLIELVGSLRQNLLACWQMAATNVEKSKTRTKIWYDKKARHRSYDVGDKVLILSHAPKHPLSARFHGPYTVLKKISDTTYVVSTPDRRRPQTLCHVNMIKRFEEAPPPPEPQAPVCLTGPSAQGVEEGEIVESPFSSEEAWLANHTIISSMETRSGRLQPDQRRDLVALLEQYPALFKDRPGRTSLVTHDIDVGDARPVKQAPYRLHPRHEPAVREEINTLLKQGLIKRGASEWCSPLLVVPKPDQQVRLCIDYRKVNSLTVKDAYPLPRIDACIEAVGKAQFITKLDLLKGFYQIKMTPRAQEIACFSVLGETFLPTVLPFGLANAPATFQRLMNLALHDVSNKVIYLDDILCYSDTWSEHLQHLDNLFSALQKAGLVINLSKSTFAEAQVMYLGHNVGLGSLAPPQAKVKAIAEMLPPISKKQVRRFLGAIGYYRRYLANFANLSLPLTDLLKKGKTFKWTPQCQQAFQALKSALCAHPVLRTPDFNHPFKLACDASDRAVAGVLLQGDEEGIDHPIAYYSKKLNPAQTNYSTIEKELLSIILSLEHFSFYILPSDPLTIITDHKPLKHLASFKHKNQRLTRWSLFLQNFNIKITHVKGTDNVLPDLLSRP